MGRKNVYRSNSKAITPEALERLLRMMAAWWQGLSLAAIGAEYGISRQRVSVLLIGVGCTVEVRRKARREQPGSGRRAMGHSMVEAREALLHPLAGRLTALQRGALAWQAQGLVFTDIARRMGSTGQGVRQHLVSAGLRLERLDADDYSTTPKATTRWKREPLPHVSPGRTRGGNPDKKSPQGRNVRTLRPTETEVTLWQLRTR